MEVINLASVFYQILRNIKEDKLIEHFENNPDELKYNLEPLVDLWNTAVDECKKSAKVEYQYRGLKEERSDPRVR